MLPGRDMALAAVQWRGQCMDTGIVQLAVRCVLSLTTVAQHGLGQARELAEHGKGAPAAAAAGPWRWSGSQAGASWQTAACIAARPVAETPQTATAPFHPCLLVDLLAVKALRVVEGGRVRAAQHHQPLHQRGVHRRKVPGHRAAPAVADLQR